MAKEVAQLLEVSLTSTNVITVELTPAVDKNTAQQLAMARAGDVQTVIIQPAG